MRTISVLSLATMATWSSKDLPEARRFKRSSSGYVTGDGRRCGLHGAPPWIREFRSRALRSAALFGFCVTLRRLSAIAVAVLLLSTPAVTLSTSARADAVGAPGCAHRTLVLAAMPLELNPLIAKMSLESQVLVEPDGQ